MNLLERDADLASLMSRWERARSGAGSLVLVGGESGIGKTALVRAFVTAAEPPSALWGACDPLTTPRSFGPLHDIADELGGVHELLVGGAFSHEVFAAVYDELRATSRVLVIDDAHWADEGTLDMLRFVLRRIGSTRSLVVVTYRDDEVGAGHPLRAVIGDAARTGDALALRLQPLSVQAVATMIGPRPLDARKVHDLTGGNAFFVGEVLAGDGDTLPLTVRDAVLARTAGLDHDARDLLDLLACAPEGIPDRALPHLGVGLRPLRALDEIGLIQRSRRGVAFRHELCRLAVAGAIPPGGEVALHLRVLEALEALGTGNAAALTHHAVAAGDAERVVRYASLAGIAAARDGAHTEAAAFFETALGHGGSQTPAEEADLLELQSAELYLVDRLQDAIAACERAIALREVDDDVGRVGAGHRALSVYEWYNANRAVAERHASTAVTLLEQAVDLPALGHAYAIEAYLALQNSDLHRARRFHERARQIAAEVDDHQLDVRLVLIDAVDAVLRGDVHARDRILATIERDAEYFDDIYSSGYSNLAYLDVEQRRFREADGVLEVSLPLTVERDVPLCNAWQLGVRGRLMLLRGDWDAAAADADEVLDAPTAPLARTWPHLVRGLVALRRGEPGCEDHLDDAWTLARRFGEPLRLLPAAAALAERAWLTAVADPRLDDAADALVSAGATEGSEWSAGDLAVWLRRAGHPVDPALPVAEPHRLLLSGEPRRAAELWDELAAPYDRALALVDSGEDGDAFAALDVLDRLGADAVAAKVRADLRERGVVGVPARRRATTRANPAGLTTRQVEVLRLLGEGLTNAELAERLFISPKTADHHVSAILSKLGVPTRREAVRAARQLDLLV